MNPSSARLLLPALLLLTALSAACGGSKASPNPAAPAVAKWQLRGTVTETATNRGLAEARIELADGPDAGASASTDSSGRYTLAGLTQAGFTVRASKAGFVTQSQPVTLTRDTTLDFTVVRASPNVKAVFEPTTIPVTASGDPRHPRQLQFTLYVQESNYVDVTVQAIEFALLMPDGRVARWTLDTAELLEDYSSLFVRGGSWKAFRWSLIYDGLPQGTLTTVVQATDADGEQYRATGSASVGNTDVASSSASAPQVRSRRPSTVPY